MKATYKWAAAAMGILTIGRAVFAQAVTVEYATQACENNAWTTLFTRNANEAIDVTSVADDWVAIRIRPTTGQSPTSVGAVSLSGSRTSTATLELLLVNECRRSQPSFEVPDTARSATNLSSISIDPAFRDHVRLTAAISGNLSGAVDVGSIYRLQVGGTIDAPVTARATDAATNTAIAFVAADNTSVAGAITALAGNIGTIEVADGETGVGLGGAVAAEAGSIGLLTARGSIEPGAAGIRARDGINEIIARTPPAQPGGAPTYHAIVGDITANANGGSGDLRRLTAAWMAGEISARQIGDETVLGNGAAIEFFSGDVQSFEFIGKVTGPVWIHAASGQVSSVLVDGDLVGDLRVLGDVDSVRITGSILPQLVYASTVRATGDVGSIVIDGECVAPTWSLPGYGIIFEGETIDEIRVAGDLAGHINCLSLGELYVAESLVGLVYCNYVESCVIKGDVQPYVWFAPDAGGFLVNEVRQGDLWQIGGTLAEDVSLLLEGNLEGQVVINAFVDGGEWHGNVYKGPDNPTPALSPVPYYTQTSASLGGGAIGLAPFHLHDLDCAPANTPLAPPSFLNSRFCHVPTVPPTTPQEIILRFYGPVKLGDASHLPVMITEETGGGTNYAASATSTIAGPTTDGARTITIHGDGATLFPAGRYHIRPLKDAAGQIIEPVCGSLLTTSTVPVGEDFDYVFDLISDCNLNGVVDADDIAAAPWLDINENDVIDSCECLLDINGDGNNDQDDVDCVTAAVSGDLAKCGLPPGVFLDFNEDGNVDQGDVDTFINAVAQGLCTW